MLCLDKPMGCLRCLEPPAGAVAAGSVPSVLPCGLPRPRRWQDTL